MVTATPTRKRLLVVDDDRLIVRMLHDLFANDFDVLTAGGGREALELLGHEQVNAVLCDNMMPEVSGIEVLRQCATAQPKAVRILITASERVQDASDAVNVARVHRFIVKPFRPVEVSGIVHGALREAELERENEALVSELQLVLEQVRARERELEIELDVRTRELKAVMDHLMEKPKT